MRLCPAYLIHRGVWTLLLSFCGVLRGRELDGGMDVRTVLQGTWSDILNDGWSKVTPSRTRVM
jgi:hypothetical protein